MNLTSVLRGVMGRKLNPILKPEKKPTREELLANALKRISINLHFVQKNGLDKWRNAAQSKR